jgi:hypothetical protein
MCKAQSSPSRMAWRSRRSRDELAMLVATPGTPLASFATGDINLLTRTACAALCLSLTACATPYRHFLAGDPVNGISQNEPITSERVVELNRKNAHFAAWLKREKAYEVAFYRPGDQVAVDEVKDLLFYQAPGDSSPPLAIRARIDKDAKRDYSGGGEHTLPPGPIWGFTPILGWLWTTPNPLIFVDRPADIPQLLFSQQGHRTETRIPNLAAFLAVYGPLRTTESLRATLQAAVNAHSVSEPGADLAAELLNLARANDAEQAARYQLPDDPAVAAFKALPGYVPTPAPTPDEKSDRTAVLAYPRSMFAIEARGAPFDQIGQPRPEYLGRVSLGGSQQRASEVASHMPGLLRSSSKIVSAAVEQGPDSYVQQIEAQWAKVDAAVAAPTDLKTRYQRYLAALGGDLDACAAQADALIATLLNMKAQAVNEQRIATAVWLEKEAMAIDCDHFKNPRWLERQVLWHSSSSWPWHQEVVVTPPAFVALTGNGAKILYPEGLSGKPTAGPPKSTVEIRMLEYEIGEPVFSPIKSVQVTEEVVRGKRQSAAFLAWQNKHDETTGRAGGTRVGDSLAGVTVGAPLAVYSDRARVSAEAAQGMRETRAKDQARADAEAASARAELERMERSPPPEFENVTERLTRTQESQLFKVAVKLRFEFEVNGKKTVCEDSGVKEDLAMDHDFNHGADGNMISAQDAKRRISGLADIHLAANCINPVLHPIAASLRAQWLAAGEDKRLHDGILAERHRALMAFGPNGALEEQARPLADTYSDDVGFARVKPTDNTPLDTLFRKAWGLPELRKP